jgi:hypothetical protein
VKTSLGLNFLRIVNEDGFNGWAQVYARIPFDDYELKDKGALFGTIFSTNVENWADKETEIMTWVDEYFNQTEKENLTDFGKKYLEKYTDIESVWLWVGITDLGGRVMKIFKTGEGSIRLIRNGEEFDLGKTMVEGKVLAGPAKEGDELMISVGGLSELLADEVTKGEEKVNIISQKLLAGNLAAAGLEFSFEKYVKDEQTEDVLFETPTMVKREISPLADVGQREEVQTELVSNRMVGPVKLKDKIGAWFRKNRKNEERTIHVSHPNDKRKKVAVLLGVVFLFLLVISIVVGTLKMQAEGESKKWREFSEPIEKSRQEAVDMAKINLVGSRKLLEDVRTTFDARKGEFMKTKYKNDVLALEKEIADSWVIASGEKESQVDNQLNLGLVRTGIVGDRIALEKPGSFLVLDNQMGLVMSAEIQSKDIKVVGGKGEGQGWLDVAYDGKQSLLLTSTGVKSVEKGTNLITFDASVAKPIVMGSFGGAMYVLDQGNKEIYKYAASGDAFGERQRWLKQGQSIGVSPIDMAIDGDVWILGSEGKVERFRRGSKENFSIGTSVGNLNPYKLAVEVNGNRLAILDTTNSQVSIFKKDDGSFVQQLKSSSLKTARDIEFDDTGNLWVLNDGQVGILR